MNQDDLTLLKHVGPARMKLLNASGITTIKQLHEIPIDKLAEVSSIGEYYAKLFKDSVLDYYGERGGDLPLKRAISIEKKSAPVKINRKLRKNIKKLRKNLNRVNENFKPLWQKKYLILYVDFKKRLTKLKARLSAFNRIIPDLPDDQKRNIIDKTDALILYLKKVGKKPKKKKYKKTIQEIQSFSKSLKDILS
jgi:hypothetical protein